MKSVFFEKVTNIKFHENPSREPSCSMRTDGQMDGQTDRRTEGRKDGQT